MDAPLPLTRELVLIGGGHAHALVLRMWAMNPMPGVRLTVINPGPTAPYSGMLPGLVAGHYQRADLEIDLVRLARAAGARVILGFAQGIDRTQRRISITDHAPIFYDILSLDIGITSDLPDLPGFSAHAVPAKPLGAFATKWQAFADRAKAGSRVLVIGAGVAGVELSMACAHRLSQNQVRGAVHLIEAGDAPLRDIGNGARRALMAQLQEHGVQVHTNALISQVNPDGVQLENGDRIAADFIIGAAGARPQAWLSDIGVDLKDGYIAVGPDLSSVSDPAIYAVGDCAHLTHAPRPKAGVFAVREAPILFHNLRADLTGGQRKTYQPQRDYLKLISTGRKRAVADKLGLRLEGDLLWRWKDRIDRKFMAQFHDLKVMSDAPQVPAIAARGLRDMVQQHPVPCGGCAAKPGVHALQQGLLGLPDPQRPDVLRGIGEDAAVLAHGHGSQVLTSDHLRAFVEDPYVLGRIAAIHALGDIWAMGARPQAALATLILPRMRERMQAEMLREIMAAATLVFRGEGADLVGGHTSVGPELTIGYAVTGLHDGQPTGLSGAQVGDALILTKPIGSGTIFAAEMQGLADGRDVAQALTIMSQPQSGAAQILAPHAHAMTDVTGYGLAGHVLSMLKASDLSAQIELEQIPLMQGALDLARSGVRSSLFEQNLALAPDIQSKGTDTDAAHRALLFDPQTAGGLLAAVPEGRVSQILEALHDQGFKASHIGALTPGAANITLR